MPPDAQLALLLGALGLLVAQYALGRARRRGEPGREGGTAAPSDSSRFVDTATALRIRDDMLRQRRATQNTSGVSAVDVAALVDDIDVGLRDNERLLADFLAAVRTPAPPRAAAPGSAAVARCRGGLILVGLALGVVLLVSG